jgi:HNH endonuclease/NUMOD3 motif
MKQTPEVIARRVAGMQEARRQGRRGGWPKGQKHSEETKAKISLAHRALYQEHPKPAPRVRHPAVCPRCGKDFITQNVTQVHCSMECSRKGFYKTKAGYVLVYRPGHPNALSNGFILEHRLVMEEKLGRPLLRTETVNHINGVKDDNRPENLQLRQGPHGKGVPLMCFDCGSYNVQAIPIADPEDT